MMGTWYGTLLVSEYGITILILMVMVHFMVTLLYGGYTCFMIGFMLCTVQIIVFLTLRGLNYWHDFHIVDWVPILGFVE